MITMMQDPGYASRLAHQYRNQQIQAAARYRLARSATTRPEKNSPEPTVARRPQPVACGT